MASNFKFYVGTLDITIGEFTNQSRYLVVANSEERAHVVLDRVAASHYGTGDEEINECGYDSDGGSVNVKPKSCREIGLAAFLELKNILSVRKDANIPADLSSDALTADGFKAFACSVRKNLEKSNVMVPCTLMLSTLAASFGAKNWQVLHDKLEALTEAPPTAIATPCEPEAPGELRAWSVAVCRIGYGFNTITVQASSRAEAEERALDEAGHHCYNEKEADYSVDFASPL